MKIRITMKDPDCMHNAVREAVEENVRQVAWLTDIERASLEESRIETAQAQCLKWFRYGEYLTVEVDTDAGTCVVLEAR